MNKLKSVDGEEQPLAERWLVSDLQDGHLLPDELSRVMKVLESSEDARATWATYHCLGDVMRQGAQAMQGACAVDFVTRLQEQLKHDSSTTRLHDAPENVAPSPFIKKASSVNDMNFRWKRPAAVACLVIGGFFSWNLMQPFRLPSIEPQLTQVPGSIPMPEAGAGAMIRDPRLDQLLAEHQQHGGASALQMPSGFLRSATFDKPTR